MNRKKISSKKRKKIYARDGYKCRKCGSTEFLTIDHIIPVSKGGSDENNNLQTLCSDCNTKRGNRPNMEDPEFIKALTSVPITHFMRMKREGVL